MNDHDLNLIIDLASGALDETAARDAMARIDASPELRREYELQRTVMDELANVEPARMTSEERMSLREQLASQLHIDGAPQPARAVAPRRNARWRMPVFGLATAAVFVVAIVVTPGLLGGSDSDADTAALSMEATTTMAAAEGADGGSTFADDSTTEETQSSTDLESAPFAPPELLTRMSINELYLAVAEGDTEAGETMSVLLSPDGVEPEVVEGCVASIGDDLPSGTARLVGVAEDGVTVVIAIEDGGEVVAVAVVDLESCELLDIGQ